MVQMAGEGWWWECQDLCQGAAVVKEMWEALDGELLVTIRVHYVEFKSQVLV